MEDCALAFKYDETKTTLTCKGKTTEVEKASPKLIIEFLTLMINNRYKIEYNNQKWPGALTTLQYDDVGIAEDSLALLQTWKNIPDRVLSVNKSIRSFYLYLLHPCDSENDHSKPWYEQRRQ